MLEPRSADTAHIDLVGDAALGVGFVLAEPSRPVRRFLRVTALDEVSAIDPAAEETPDAEPDPNATAGGML